MLSLAIALIIGPGCHVRRIRFSQPRLRPEPGGGFVRHPVGTRPCQDAGMDEYFIGAGALLTAGPSGSITGAALHAQTEAGLAARIKAAVIDFEATRQGELARVLVVAAGWSRPRFQGEVVACLQAERECTLADVIAVLAQAAGTSEVHLFAHWHPDDGTLETLRRRGIGVVPHPLEAIGQAALVCGQRVARWPVQAPPRVAKHDAA